ncbi:MAG: alcohol dehydrogenase catalytic domain-containing protein [Anaerolineales bacterium]|jgi:threonine dehydrogenase-like Zn-dependent dehydrogenase|nr:alcohol dehydrogenase catalytic domain-containing protein [Anaerolineales bacterium]
MKGLVLDAKWKPKSDYKVSDWEKETGKAVTGSSVWHNPTLEIRDWPDPTPGPKEVLIDIQACGVCGSDMHFYETDDEDYILYPGLTKFPTILGHEFSGKVAEVGKDVTLLQVGDMVTVEEMVWCGRCTPCRNGFPNHCTNLEEIGFTIPGAFANFIAVDEKLCWKIDGIAEQFGSEEMGYSIGALTEPTCVSYNALFERGEGFRPGHYFGVFGAGSIGLAAIGLAKAAGAGTIVSFEISPQRMELAKKIGADFVYDPREVNPHEVLMEHSKGEGFDFLYEASGVPEIVVPEMVKSLAINGKIVQIGRAAQSVPMYLETIQVRRGQVYGSQGHSGHENFPNVIRMVSAGRLDLSPIITAQYKLDDAVKAIAQSTTRTDGKIIVRPN